ncbi:MAG: tyrosine-type recombinase/integrase [Tepidisphaeraceae bacterium]
MIKFVGKALAATTLRDLQAFADDLEQIGLAPASRHRTLSAVKSLFGFGSKLGYFAFDVGRALRLPTPDSRLAERILDEGQVERMLMLEVNPRNGMMLTVLYATGLRITELASLKWRDCVARQSGGQLTVMGKGNRIRAVLLPASVWCGLVALRKGADDGTPVFRSREGSHLHRSQLMRLVARAAKRAGIAKSVSPHWLRHAHVSHALDHGCPVHVVAQTVGHASLHSTTRYAHARPTESSSTYLPI